jgi:hypothetical protein
MVVCNKVKEEPEVPFVNESMKLLPCKLRFRLVLKTLSSEEVTAPVPNESVKVKSVNI